MQACPPGPADLPQLGGHLGGGSNMPTCSSPGTTFQFQSQAPFIRFAKCFCHLPAHQPRNRCPLAPLSSSDPLQSECSGLQCSTLEVNAPSSPASDALASALQPGLDAHQAPRSLCNTSLPLPAGAQPWLPGGWAAPGGAGAPCPPGACSSPSPSGSCSSATAPPPPSSPALSSSSLFFLLCLLFLLHFPLPLPARFQPAPAQTLSGSGSQASLASTLRPTGRNGCHSNIGPPLRRPIKEQKEAGPS